MQQNHQWTCSFFKFAALLLVFAHVLSDVITDQFFCFLWANDRSEQDADALTRAQTIDDLHNRLKSNVETIQQLNQQLNTLNKDNLRQRHMLDRESAARKVRGLNDSKIPCSNGS